MLNSTSFLFDALTRTTVALSIAACIGWLILKLFRARAARTHRIVWGAVLVQGCLFWNVLLPILPPKQPQPAHPAATPIVQHDSFLNTGDPVLFDAAQQSVPPSAGTNIETVPRNDKPATSGTSLPVMILIGVWACGIVVLVLRFFLRYAGFLRSLHDAEPAPAEWSREWDTTRNEAGVKADIPLLLHPAGPLLCRVPGGYRLLVPADQWSALSASRRRAILLHELAHYRRGDIWKSLAARLMLLPHWFNPFAWLAARRFDECAEWACDDAVCRQPSQLVTEYAHTLLDLTAGGHTPAAYSPGAGGRCLADRIRRLFNPVSKEDLLMKRISLFTLVTALSLVGFIRVGSAESDPFLSSADLPTQAVSPTATMPEPPVVPQLPTAASKSPQARNPKHRAASQRTFKIDEAVIDVAYIFKNLPEFQRGRDRIKKQVAAADATIRKHLDEFRKAEAKGNQTILQRERYLNLRQVNRTRLLKMESTLYTTVYAKIQTEVARYAKENDIRIVKRVKSAIPANASSSNPKTVLQKINQEIVYQADERVDITNAILKRLIAADRGAKQKTPLADPFAN